MRMNISGSLFAQAVISAANHIINEKSKVDELNVFPVPDGDTGTNMSMTMTNGKKAVEALEESAPIGEVAKTFATALLRGARGNSGVILSLLFRGFSKGLKGRVEANGSDVAYALKLGTESAYKAVMKPTEGTILTVARLASEAGEEAAMAGKDAVEVFDVIVSAAKQALDQTPELLPVLKAGGYQKVTAVPLMLVAGDHALNDMAGEEPESWKSRLTQAGFSVDCRLQGLGELEEVQRLYANRARMLLEGEE